MASYVTPKKNTEYIFYIGLQSQADTKLIQANPTLAAGDARVSIDGGAFANLTTLPVVTPAGGKGVKVTLSAAEMNGDNVTVLFSDAAGAEWCDLLISIQTTANQVDDLALASALTTVDTVVDAIKLVTDNLPNSGSLTDLAAILVDTDITIPALIAALNDFNPTTDPVEVGSLLVAALAQFVTDDTGQIAAVPGSVADLAQGAAAGNVTVGAMTQAALAQFVLDDTGQIAAAAGSVGLLAQGAASVGSNGSESVPVFDWTLNGVHEVDFVLTDNAGVEVTGLGGTFTFELRKAGGVFVAGAGTKAEIGDGWYRYTSTAAEADTIGPVAMRAIGAGSVQQNLLAVVETLQINAVYYTYTVTDIATGFPVPRVVVWVTTDIAGNNVIINDLLTDSLGVARTPSGFRPLLDAGTYYFWKRKVGVIDNDFPDTEVVS